MKLNFYKGLHYGLPLGNIRPKLNKWQHVLDVAIKFDDSIRYDLGKDQNDVNKLLGVSYGLNHHYQSDRVGFRYSKDQDKVELVLYSYILGKRVPTRSIGFYEINKEYYITLYVSVSDNKRKVLVTVNDNEVTWIPEENLTEFATEFCHEPKKLSWITLPYFGGNRRAPHKITIDILKCRYSAFNDYE